MLNVHACIHVHLFVCLFQREGFFASWDESKETLNVIRVSGQAHLQ